MKINENFAAYLKTISIISLTLAFVFAFFDGLKSIAFTALAFLCAVRDMQINVVHTKGDK